MLTGPVPQLQRLVVYGYGAGKVAYCTVYTDREAQDAIAAVKCRYGVLARQVKAADHQDPSEYTTRP